MKHTNYRSIVNGESLKDEDIMICRGCGKEKRVKDIEDREKVEEGVDNWILFCNECDKGE